LRRLVGESGALQPEAHAPVLPPQAVVALLQAPELVEHAPQVGAGNRNLLAIGI
jgi:hypothetical protein